jgi:hypothetical protein
MQKKIEDFEIPYGFDFTPLRDVFGSQLVTW